MSALRMAKYATLILAGAAALVAGGVAVNQILDDGKLSWTWAYLAFGLMILSALLASAVEMAYGPGRAADRVPRIYRRTYMRQVRASVADMETIGVVTQGEFVLRAKQVYVDVVLQPRPAREAVGDGGIGVLVPPAEPGARRGPLAAFLTRGRVLAVLGPAGSGKTTMARTTALHLAERHWRFWRLEFWRRRSLPVLLYLRDHTEAVTAGEPPTLAEVAVTAPWLRGKIPARWLDRWLDRGRCVVLLDGLDEIASVEERRRAVVWVSGQIARYPGNAFVVTSRPHGYLSNPLPTSDVLQVQRFTPDQIASFLRFWYRAIERRAREGRAGDVQMIADSQASDLVGRLRRTPALYDLATNPLLLTMIANVHRYRGALPGSRAALYAEMCDVLLHRRQEAKNLADPAGLDGPKKERIMQELALRMMRNRQRDISAEDAQNAISDVLHRMARHLTPARFLDHIRLSGLILEREHGQYAFAHLTLQEYLAAIRIRNQPADLALLSENVDDPWWRETTLLWCSGADANPVVRACLDSGSVQALSLAFACADHALDLDAESRDELDGILATAAADPSKARLVAAVIASRVLHDTVLLGSGTSLCLNPVPGDLWNEFARTEALRGRRTPARDNGSAPATGVLVTDVPRFVEWLNTLFDDDTRYTPPSRTEITGPGSPATVVARPSWIFDIEHRLYLPADAAHPYRPTSEQVARYRHLIVGHAYPLLRLITSESPISLAGRLIYANITKCTAPGALLIRTIELAATLCHLRIAQPADTRSKLRVLIRVRDLARDVTRDLRRVRVDVNERALAKVEELAHSLDLRLSPARPRGLFADELSNDPGLTFAGDLAPDRMSGVVHDLVHDLANAIARARDIRIDTAVHPADGADPDLDLGSDFDSVPGRDLDQVLGRLLGRVLVLSREGDGGQSLALALDGLRHLDFDLGLVRVLGRVLDLARDLSFARFRDFDRVHTENAAFIDLDTALFQDDFVGPARALDLALANVVQRDFVGPTHDLDLALTHGGLLVADLAVARAAVRYDHLQDARMLLACKALLRAWAAARAARRRSRSDLSLPEFLARSLESVEQCVPADDPPAALRKAVNYLPPGTDREVVAVIECAQTLVGQMWGRARPMDEPTLAMAGTVILAALVQLPEVPAARTQLLSALATVIAFTSPDHARPAAEPTLFLVRV
ncbi:NACHT domain-containing protein [Acrocarpospora phusangensis]|uniref:NACHT domain-containing protein n=1 Tax=Acrocarpospora phusangensis TaxID=1070424 RepID=UPI00194DB327|nr:NACHT domain-containing protein [Acrocarpospora phusangensis]